MCVRRRRQCTRTLCRAYRSVFFSVSRPPYATAFVGHFGNSSRVLFDARTHTHTHSRKIVCVCENQAYVVYCGPVHRLRIAGRVSRFFPIGGIENPLKADASLCSVRQYYAEKEKNEKKLKYRKKNRGSLWSAYYIVI